MTKGDERMKRPIAAMAMNALLGGIFIACAPAAEAPDASQAVTADEPAGDAGEGEAGASVDVGEQAEAGEQTAEPASAEIQGGGRLELVKSRGELICGVNDQLAGFGYVDPDGEFAGFDVDFCRAIAAAVLGDAGAVAFRPLSAQQRFTALQTGEVDVLIRNTTWTLARDTQNGLDFAPTTFYDGQGIMTPVEQATVEMADLDGASICVGSGTTTERNLGDAMREAGADYTPVVFEGADEVFNAYESGRCDAVTADRSALVARQTTMSDPAAHEILETVLSKEPLGPAVLQGDPRWADVVNWVVLGLIQAEEFGITSQNVASFVGGDVPEVRRFLGEEDALGAGLGLDDDFMITVLESVGNYAEIYDRNLGPDTPFDLERGINRLWQDGGLLYSPPFR